eukprot:TRINITY_DN1175_c0_g1_i1.p1 TRINITY_DN1175_c0_g1~~TRINITY_DN1175_c0_g1_i1.p1  ORF type:complete len:844 (-),score=218.24 TRINITY_DN1175_c0_g1_i1:59-2443(-)
MSETDTTTTSASSATTTTTTTVVQEEEQQETPPPFPVTKKEKNEEEEQEGSPQVDSAPRAPFSRPLISDSVRSTSSMSTLNTKHIRNSTSALSVSPTRTSLLRLHLQDAKKLKRSGSLLKLADPPTPRSQALIDVANRRKEAGKGLGKDKKLEEKVVVIRRTLSVGSVFEHSWDHTIDYGEKSVLVNDPVPMQSDHLRRRRTQMALTDVPNEVISLVEVKRKNFFHQKKKGFRLDLKTMMEETKTDAPEEVPVDTADGAEDAAEVQPHITKSPGRYDTIVMPKSPREESPQSSRKVGVNQSKLDSKKRVSSRGHERESTGSGSLKTSNPTRTKAKLKKHKTFKREKSAILSIFRSKNAPVPVVPQALNIFHEKLPNKQLLWEECPEVEGQKNRESDPQKWVLVGASTAALLETMTVHTNNAFSEVLIVTHSHYVSSKQMMMMLAKLYKKFKEKKEIRSQLRLINVIKHWFLYNLNDFHPKSSVNKELETFLKKLKASSNDMETKMGEVISSAWGDAFLDQKTEQEERLEEAISLAPRPHASKALLKAQTFPTSVTILDLDPVEIARQLTLAFFDLFLLIRGKELLNKNFDKPDKAPNLFAFSKFFNHVTDWIGTQVLSFPTPKQRARVIEIFIAVCDKFVELKNYCGIFAVVSSLCHFAIDRLHETWRLLPKREKEKWDLLQDFATPMGNFKNMRVIAENAQPPTIPPLALLVKDLTFIEDGNEDYSDSKKKIINVEKVFMLGKIVQRVKHIQAVRYQLAYVECLQDLLTNGKVMNEDEREATSKSLESGRKEV